MVISNYRSFNGLDQLTAEYQSHSGAVNTSTTPAVQYTYSEMSGGENHSRLTSVTYPDTFTVSYQQGQRIKIQPFCRHTEKVGKMAMNSRVIELGVSGQQKRSRFMCGKNRGAPLVEKQGPTFYASQSSQEKTGEFDFAKIRPLATLTLMHLPCIEWPASY